ncbi:MAG TPA: UDP-2,3-diacylglucosamine diphosphatase [Geobacteraceae bacterium]|nr:UDP-2,3-diacylglucosamine diphosphatase [Geobacteraceae bacterium]
MRKVFIADAHLRNPEDENYRKLLLFLAGLKGTTDTLFILGDLFEFWIGYRHPPFTHYFPVLEQLRQLTESGTRIIYFEGNHDFHMGPFFKETLKATVYRGPAIIDINGKKVYVCHGDQINSRDIGYRLLRFVMHNRLSGALVPIIPAGGVSALAVRMSRASKQIRQVRTTRSTWDHLTILRQFATARFTEGCDMMITGHFHQPLLEKSAHGGERTLLALGDWITQFSYAEWTDGELSLKTYHET